MIWVQAALVIFMAVFVLVTLAVVFRGAGHFDRAARIPFNDGDAGDAT